ncbi:helix-turn-helix domain-containing protein [Pediococcus acidilactici]|uniref:helix-turn-helix domain-containing protein n=1 Tax=Pediococcus acidilactici TaxID=1254 RepID=UPI001EF7389F|nr:AraC family transcriptional regulator [Pediococcus acidilactici]
MGNEYITRAVKFIYDHIEEKVSLSTLTKGLDISKSYLSRIFRQTVGKSVNEFILDIKMKQASYYLQDTSLAVSQIASRLGYEDPYYFSRTFKKSIGKSPREYRKKHNRQL